MKKLTPFLRFMYVAIGILVIVVATFSFSISYLIDAKSESINTLISETTQKEMARLCNDNYELYDSTTDEFIKVVSVKEVFVDGYVVLECAYAISNDAYGGNMTIVVYVPYAYEFSFSSGEGKASW